MIRNVVLIDSNDGISNFNVKGDETPIYEVLKSGDQLVTVNFDRERMDANIRDVCHDVVDELNSLYGYLSLANLLMSRKQYGCAEVYVKNSFDKVESTINTLREKLDPEHLVDEMRRERTSSSSSE